MSTAIRFRALLDEGFTADAARAIARLEDRENDLLDLLAERDDAMHEAELADVRQRLAALTTPAKRRAA